MDSIVEALHRIRHIQEGLERSQKYPALCISEGDEFTFQQIGLLEELVNVTGDVKLAAENMLRRRKWPYNERA